MHHAFAPISEDDWVIVDGDAGVVIVNPAPLVLEEYRRARAQLDLEREKLKRLKTKPADDPRRHAGRALRQHRAARRLRGSARGGRRRRRPVPHRVPVHEPRRSCRARTSSSRPTATSLQAMGGRPVTIRTLDIGADKPLERRRHDADMPEPGAGPARDPLLPRRAADVPDPAARDPARLALRQGAHPAADARARARDRADARADPRRPSSSSTSAASPYDRDDRARRHDRDPGGGARAADLHASASTSCRSAPTT